MKGPVWQLKWVLWLIAAGSVAAATPQATPNQVTFNQNIAPIVYQNCAPCHRPGEAAPFSLLGYEDAKRHAMQIADVTKRRYMPPWLPEPGKGDFQEERRLTDAQIQLIQDWVRDGAPEGPAEGAPAPPKFSSEWQLGPPDLILHVPKPYELYASGPEVFWNFILPVPIKTSKWVKAMAIRPGNPRVFHHANVILDRSGSALRQEIRPGEGFPGMDLTVEEHTFDPDGHFLSWKPGSQPVVEPDGMAWRADPGMDLVLNVHLRPSGKREIVSPEIGLYFTDQPQTKFPMLLELEHDGALDIPAGDKDYLSSDDFHVPMDMNVLAVYPHAHYLCKLMEGYATLPDGTRKWLIRIPNWDLNWQGVYNYKKPVFVPKGSVISMRYHYDNSADNPRNPNHPPKRVKNGNEALDEMGDLWLQVLPVGDTDQRAELQASVTKQRLEKYPTDFVANFDMGDLLLNQDKAAEAITYFERACQRQPTSPLAASELGVALVNASRLPEARDQFKRALQLDPKYTDARYNLASLEATTGDWESATNDFKEVTVEKPDNAKAKQHLGEVMFLWGDDLAKSGDYNQAVLRYRDALVYRPDDPDLHTNLGMALARVNQIKEATAEFEAAVRIDPNAERAKEALTAIQRQ